MASLIEGEILEQWRATWFIGIELINSSIKEAGIDKLSPTFVSAAWDGRQW